MHLIAAIPGGWTPNSEGVLHIDQSPGDIVFLSAGDTELSAFFNAYQNLYKNNENLPSLRMANLVYLKQELTIDTYEEEVLEKAKLIVLRLLGGRSYFPYLVERLVELNESYNIPIIFLPGHDAADPELTELSSVDASLAQRLWEFFLAGGVGNSEQALQLLLNRFFGYEYKLSPSEILPDIFIYHPDFNIVEVDQKEVKEAQVVIIAYRAHYLADNLNPIRDLIKNLHTDGITAMVVFVHSLRESWQVNELSEYLFSFKENRLGVVINTTSFSIRHFQDDPTDFIFSQLGIPVIQAIHASSTFEAWKEGTFGLSPSDIAMNVALPELDGRIITRAISFKKEQARDLQTDSTITYYDTYPEGCSFVSRFAVNWLKLQTKANKNKRIAVLLPNYPCKDSRLGNGVGLDTPQSAVELLKALKQNAYDLGDEVPGDSAELMEMITSGLTNEKDSFFTRTHHITLKVDDFYRYYKELSPSIRSRIADQWGSLEDDPFFDGEAIALSGKLLGNVFVGIQPSRGYHVDIQQTYHSPDLPPPYYYLAFYFWCRYIFRSDAIIHLGKHGNLEWLPGKSLSLDVDDCFPAAILGDIPHFYPFIINDPGEGTQAKRRSHAVIIDHLIPPMTRAETYGYLMELEHLIDEYYEAANLDPKRTVILTKSIQELVNQQNLKADLGIEADDVNELLLKLDGYLCEIKEAQIRDGLHILGNAPRSEQLVDLLVALHRMPVQGFKGITQSLADDLKLDFDPLNIDYASPAQVEVEGTFCRTYGDVVEQLELIAAQMVRQEIGRQEQPEVKDDHVKAFPSGKKLISFMVEHTLPLVEASENEISNLLHGLEGKYVPAGGSGAPTRGCLDVLPTGKNFYSVDVRTIPSETAYQVGKKSAEALLELYLQEHGEYPENIGISVWGTATMRTGGDDIAQAMALMGVRPLWQKSNRRLVDFEVVPLFQLGRPRIDVTLRISGFFRDAFPDIISLMNAIVEKLASLDEPEDENFIRKKVNDDTKKWQEKGFDTEEAREKAIYRVFGSKPGAYGAGLQALIDEQGWENRGDLAQAYMEWSSYAYDKSGKAITVPDVLRQKISQMQVVIQNQDNREHDILDSDDYYQFHGGLANAVEIISGKKPATYFGDHSRPENPRVKTLKQELLKVFRSRVVNPKWIAGVKRHGYKGAFEMAATLDYLFAYDATTNLVDDFMYEDIAQAYLFDEDTSAFIEKVNPWALRDMSERLLEAIQRKMWQNPEDETLQKLQDLYVSSE